MLPSEIIKQVRRIEITTGRLVAETFAGEYHSVFKGRGMEFAEVREYIPGDDVRSIDWNVTARLGKPFIKRYVEERELTVMIACDMSGSQFFGTEKKLKSQIAAELSALFAFSALKNSDKAGLVIFTDRIELYIPPRKGKTHVLRLIRELLAHKPQSKGTAIGPCLDVVNRLLKRRSILLLISDFMDMDFEKTLKLSAKKHDLIPVLISDKREKSLPRLNAILQTQDPETGLLRAIDLSSAETIGSYADNASARQDHIRRFLKTIGVNHMQIPTEGRITDPVVRFFRERAKKFKR